MQMPATFLRRPPVGLDEDLGIRPNVSAEHRWRGAGVLSAGIFVMGLARGGPATRSKRSNRPSSQPVSGPSRRTTATAACLVLILGLGFGLTSSAAIAEALGIEPTQDVAASDATVLDGQTQGVQAQAVAAPLHDLPRLGGVAAPGAGPVDRPESSQTGEPLRAGLPEAAVGGTGVEPAGQPPAASAARLEQAAAELRLFSPRLLTTFYRQRGYRPAWSPVQAQVMIDLAHGSRWHGLEPSEFHLDALRELVSAAVLEGEPRDGDARWRAELLLSDALLRYLHHLQYGQFNPRQINPDWTFVDSIDAALLTAEMHAVLAAADLGAAVDEVLPRAPFYEQLKRGYQRYLALAEAPDAVARSAAIPPGANLKIGMRDPRVPVIRERFERLDGYRFGSSSDPDIYDRALYEAVREFQGRSGLAQDGVIGPRTLAALNRPFRERLAIIRANLERMRWLYHGLRDNYLLVDIAAFQLQLMRGHEPVWSTRTIVGTREDQTPMFRDEVEHLVFNPTWSVPPSIQKEMRSVPSGYRVIDRRTGRRVTPSDPTNWRRYRLVQSAGPKNALGRVKFMFPNGHAIYLHDTPSRHLFSRPERAYSHGCVRVDNPLELAQELLGAPQWQMDEIERVLDRGRTRYVNLEAHLPVLLYYITARADEAGRVGFRPDIYERDAQLLAAMEQPASAARIVFNDASETVAETGPAEAQSVSQADGDGAQRDDGGPDGVDVLPNEANEASIRQSPPAMWLAANRFGDSIR
jgi:murein L,D-transpeptidase YcbB/YkuD